MTEAERQYEAYCKVYARNYGCTVEEAKRTAICEEYRKYCEDVLRKRNK